MNISDPHLALNSLITSICHHNKITYIDNEISTVKINKDIKVCEITP